MVGTSRSTPKILAVLTIIAMIVILSLLHSPLGNGPRNHDTEIYRYIGMVINKGGLPYVDVFDHKPPMIYFLAALGYRAGVWGLWWVMLIAVLAAALFLYRVVITEKIKYNIALIFIFAILIRYSPVLQEGQQTRELTSCLIIIQICFFILNRQWWSYLIQGVISGAILMTQQNELLATLPIIGYFLVKSSADVRDRLVKLAAFTVGGISFCGAICLFFLVRGGFNEFIQAAFQFNFKYYISGGGSRLADFGRTLLTLFSFKLIAYSVVLLASLAGLSYYWIKKKTFSALVVVFLSALVIELIFISLSGRTFRHYFLGLIPYLVFLSLLAVQDVERISLRASRWSVAAVCSLMIFLVAGHLFGRYLPRLRASSSTDISQELKSVAGQNGQFYVFRDSTQIKLYNDLDLVAPSKWIFTYIWDKIPSWDPNGQIYQEILSNLRTSRCQYILDYSSVNPIRPVLQAKWDGFVRERYQLIEQNKKQGWVLYKIK